MTTTKAVMGARLDVDRSTIHEEIIVLRVTDLDDAVVTYLSPSDARALAASLLAIVADIEARR